MRKLLIGAAVLIVLELLLLREVVARNGYIGLLLLEVVTAAIGIRALSQHGSRALSLWRRQLPGSGGDGQAWDVGLAALGGVLLVIPGVLTDILGGLLVFFPTRALIAPLVRARFSGLIGSTLKRGPFDGHWTPAWFRKEKPPTNGAHSKPGAGDVIDLDSRRNDKDDGSGGPGA